MHLYFRLESSKCSLEIQKPLQKEELGVWRMYLDERNSKGCVFQIGPKVNVTGSNVAGKSGQDSLKI